MQNHYQTLNLNDSATQEEIKASYRKLAMKHHPDRGGDSEKFKAVNTAYSVLSNEQTRQDYDQSLKQRPSSSGHGFGSWASFFDAEMAAAFNNQYQSPVKQVAIDVPIRDIMSGKSFELSINSKTLKVTVPKMFPHGESIIMPGMAKNIFGDRFTDLHIIVRWSVPRGIEISGLDVYYTVETSVLNLIFGGSITVDLLDDTTVEIKIPENTNTQTTMRVPGRGLKANSGDTGNMFVRTVPSMPKANDPLYQDLKQYLSSKK